MGVSETAIASVLKNAWTRAVEQETSKGARYRSIHCVSPGAGNARARLEMCTRKTRRGAEKKRASALYLVCRGLRFVVMSFRYLLRILAGVRKRGTQPEGGNEKKKKSGNKANKNDKREGEEGSVYARSCWRTSKFHKLRTKLYGPGERAENGFPAPQIHTSFIHIRLAAPTIFKKKKLESERIKSSTKEQRRGNRYRCLLGVPVENERKEKN